MKNNSMKLCARSFSSVAVLAFTLAACAPQSEKGDMGDMGDMGGMGGMGMAMGDGGHEEEITFGEPGKAAEVTRTITVNIEDMAYDLKNLTVKDGETVRFIIVNKDETEHEFTLGTADMQAEDREKMAKQSDAGESMEMMEPNAVSVGSLETRELIWKFKGPGEIEFDCNVPGHYEAGMKGNIKIVM